MGTIERTDCARPQISCWVSALELSREAWLKMNITMRRTFWDHDSGSEYIADWESDHWEFAEREWGDVIWRVAPPTHELLAMLEKSKQVGCAGQ
jgi:hypothetical protein